MTFPDNLKYTKDHEWILVEGTTGTVGITDYASVASGARDERAFFCFCFCFWATDAACALFRSARLRAFCLRAAARSAPVMWRFGLSGSASSGASSQSASSASRSGSDLFSSPIGLRAARRR